MDTTRLDEEAEEIVDQRVAMVPQLQRAAGGVKQVSMRGLFQ